MKQFDICQIKGRGIDYALILQNEILDIRKIRLIAPLLLANAYPIVKKINPKVRIGEKDYVIAFELILALPVSALGKAILSFESRRSEVSDAIDFLLQGF